MVKEAATLRDTWWYDRQAENISQKSQRTTTFGTFFVRLRNSPLPKRAMGNSYLAFSAQSPAATLGVVGESVEQLAGAGDGMFAISYVPAGWQVRLRGGHGRGHGRCGGDGITGGRNLA